MKQFLFLLLATFAFSHISFAQTVNDPIVDINQAEGFGLWRIYNSDNEIYLVDSQDGVFIRTDSTTNGILFYTMERDGFLLHDSGTASSLQKLSADHPRVKNAIQAVSIEISAHIQDGLFGFGSKRFLVNGDHLTIFNENDFDPINNRAVPQTTIAKFSNAVTHEGSNTNTNFDPTVIVDENDIPGPARILGDCVTTYSAEEQKLTIPCLQVNNDSTIYEIDLRQAPDSLNFSADLPTFNRVQ